MQKMTLGGLGKNEPKRTQTNPISEKPKMNVNFLCHTAGADKIALQIHPFGVDCPIVLYETLFDL